MFMRPRVGYHFYNLNSPVITWEGECVENYEGNSLSHIKGFSTTNTPAECIESCKDHGYAGVQGGDHCFCSNSPPPFSNMKTSSECNMTCTGDRSHTCGGKWRAGVFKTKGQFNINF